MSVSGYFRKRDELELRMPRLEDGVDELGIRYEGDVLTGRMTVAEALFRSHLEPPPAPHTGPVAARKGVPLNTLTPAEWARKIARERAQRAPQRSPAGAPRRKK